MTRHARLRCAALSISLVAVGLAAPLAASAAPLSTVTVSAAATGPTSGAATDTRATITVTITVAGAPIAATVLTAPVPGTVDPVAVRVDNGVAPTGTVSGTTGNGRTDLTVRLGAGATPLAGGILEVGKHTVTIPTDLARRTGTTIAPVATRLDYLTAGGGAGNAADTVTIPLPDLVVSKPAGSGEDSVLPLAPGSEAFFAARIVSRSPVTAATLTVTVPSGLRVDSAVGVIRVGPDGRPSFARCAAPAGTTVSCPLGPITGSILAAVGLQPTGAAPVGSTATFTVAAVAGNGLDADPTDNAVQGTVRLVPATRLRVTVTADHTTVEVGSKARVGLAVTNLGSYPAPDVLGIIVVANRDLTKKSAAHFRVTKFTGREADLGGTAGGGTIITAGAPRAMREAATVFGRRIAARPQAAKDGPPIDVVTWSVGTLAPQATRRSVLTVKALSPGKDRVVAAATSLQGLDGCFLESEDPVDCPEVDQITLTAVTAAGTDTDSIAATGVPTEGWLGLALLLLTVGAAAQFAGVRTAAGRHRS